LLSEDELWNVKVLVFVNKRDLLHTVDLAEVTKKLGLLTVQAQQWHLQGCCSTIGEGMHEGHNWLANTLCDVA